MPHRERSEQKQLQACDFTEAPQAEPKQPLMRMRLLGPVFCKFRRMIWHGMLRWHFNSIYRSPIGHVPHLEAMQQGTLLASVNVSVRVSKVSLGLLSNSI